MDYKEVLKAIAESVDGAIGIGLVGLDGMVIDQYSATDDFDVTMVGAEYSSVIKNAGKASQDFGLGPTTEILITTEQATMIMMMVGDNYFAVLAINQDGNLGRGRLEMKKHIPKIEKEMMA